MNAQRKEDQTFKAGASVKMSPELFRLLGKIQDRSQNAICERLIKDAQVYTAELLTEQTEIDFLSISEDNPQFISYVQVAKVAAMIEAGTIWDAKKRLHGKPAKTVRKLYSDEFSSDQYEAFAAQIFKYQSPERANMTFKILEGEDIFWAYNEDHYLPENECEVDRLHGSCMRFNYRNKFMQLYADNSDECKIAVVVNGDNQVLSRALIWHGVRISGEYSKVPCFDRIYATSNDVEALMFRKFEELNYTDIYQHSETLRISLPEYDQDYHPYIDTFRYSDEWGNFCSDSGEFTYDNQDGSRSSEEDNYEDEDYCTCDQCGDGGSWEDMNSIENRDMRVCDGCCEYVSGDGYYLNNEVTEDENGDNILKVDAVDTINGETWHRDLCTQDHNEEWIKTEDSVKTEDGNRYHEDEEGQLYVEVLYMNHHGNAWIHDCYMDIANGEYVDCAETDHYIRLEDAVEIDGLYYHVNQFNDTTNWKNVA